MIGAMHSVNSAAHRACHYCKEHPGIVVYMAVGGLIGAVVGALIPSVTLKVACIALGILIGERIYARSHNTPQVPEVDMAFVTFARSAETLVPQASEVDMSKITPARAMDELRVFAGIPDKPEEAEYTPFCQFLSIEPRFVSDLWDNPPPVEEGNLTQGDDSELEVRQRVALSEYRQSALKEIFERKGLATAES